MVGDGRGRADDRRVGSKIQNRHLARARRDSSLPPASVTTRFSSWTMILSPPYMAEGSIVSTRPGASIVSSPGLLDGGSVMFLPRPWPKRPTLPSSMPGVLQHLGLGEEHVGRGPAGPRRLDAGLGRLPQQVVHAPGFVGRLAERDVAVEVAEIPAPARAGVDQEDVALAQAARQRPLDDAVVAALARADRGIGRLVRRPANRARPGTCARCRVPYRRPRPGPAGGRTRRRRSGRCAGCARLRPADLISRKGAHHRDGVRHLERPDHGLAAATGRRPACPGGIPAPSSTPNRPKRLGIALIALDSRSSPSFSGRGDGQLSTSLAPRRRAASW